MTINLGDIPWAPTVGRVAAHILSRTRDEVSNEPVGTFNTHTAPTGDQVREVITSAVATIGGLVGEPIVPAAYDLCQTAAALWAAYWVELQYPDRDANVSVFQRLRDDALALVKQAQTVNEAGGGGTTSPGDDPDGITGLSRYSFPPARIVCL